MSRTLPSLTVKEFLLWLIGRRRRFQVNGPSMLPLLKPSDEVLVNPSAYKSKGPHPIPGELVIVRHPTQSDLLMVKRIVAIVPKPSPLTVPQKPGVTGKSDVTDKIDAPLSVDSTVDSNQQKSADSAPPNTLYYWIEGDNPLASTDSRSFGPVAHACILGKVTTRFS